MANTITITINGVEEGFILHEKKFRTGSRGFNTSDKMTVGDKRYQVTVNIVEIGSRQK